MKKEYKKLISLILAVAAAGTASALLSACSGSNANTPDISTNSGTVPEEKTVTSPEPETTPEPKTTAEPPKLTLRIGSYNIKHGADASGELSLIGGVIKNAGLDIVGVQEVDYKTERVSGVDQPAALAAAAGMEYYKFARAIDYQGGEYGTLILSRYPIEEFTVTALESGSREGRSIGHAVINVDGVKVDFFNTHLSYEEKALRTAQFVKIKELLSDCTTYVLTGDFNTQDYSEFTVLGYGGMLNNAQRHYVTFPGNKSSIDNIVFSGNFKISKSGTVAESYSDHRMLWAELALSLGD